MSTSSVKGKSEIKLTLEPANNLEREFFNNLFSGGTATVETIPGSDEVILTIKDKNAPEEKDNLPF